MTECTLVIPTHNRPELLARLLRYLSAEGVALPVLVMDSSEQANASRNREAVRTASLDIRHLVFDPTTPHATKVISGVEQVKTSCFSFCADDDVVFLEAVHDCVDFLRTRDEYHVAHGYCLGFVEQGNVFKIPAMLFAGPSIDQDTPAARVYALMRSYEPIFYGVVRTRTWLKSMKRVFQVQDFLFREFLPACETVVLGKVCRLPRVYSACRIDNPPAEETNPRTFTGNPVQWFLREPEEMVSQYIRYRNAIVDALVEAGEPEARKPTLARGLDILHLGYLASGIDHAMAGHHAADVLGLREPLKPGDPGYIDPEGLVARGRQVGVDPSNVTFTSAKRRGGRRYVLSPRFINYLAPWQGRKPVLDRADLLGALQALDAY